MGDWGHEGEGEAKDGARPWTVTCAVGCLVEVGFGRLGSVDQVRELSDAVGRAIAKTHDRTAIVVDLRAAAVSSQAVANAAIDLLTRASRPGTRMAVVLRVERDAWTTQLARLIRVVGDPGRRTFLDPGAVLAWLGEFFDEDERERARAFLAVESGNA